MVAVELIAPPRIALLGKAPFTSDMRRLDPTAVMRLLLPGAVLETDSIFAWLRRQ